MRLSSTFIGLLFLAPFLGFMIWRWPAPTFRGQNLHLTQSVPETFEILLVGDSGTGHSEQAGVAIAMERYCQSHPLSAVVLLGDNFYQNGVSGIEDPQFQSAFLQPYGRDCLGKLPFYAILGNHDYKGYPQAEVDFHSETPRWIMPHRFYELQFGTRLQIVALDTNVLDFCGLASYCTLDFLRQTLSDTHPQSRLLIGHHPIGSSSEKYQKTSFQSRLLEAMLCDKSVIYVAGHAHHMEHRQSKRCQLEQFISGAGGAELYPIRHNDPNSRFAEAVHGFLSLQVAPQSLHFRFLDDALHTLYDYKI